MSRKLLPPPTGALVVAVGALGSMTEHDRKQPERLQINLGEDGVAVKNE